MLKSGGFFIIPVYTRITGVQKKFRTKIVRHAFLKLFHFHKIKTLYDYRFAPWPITISNATEAGLANKPSYRRDSFSLWWFLLLMAAVTIELLK